VERGGREKAASRPLVTARPALEKGGEGEERGIRSAVISLAEAGRKKEKRGDHHRDRSGNQFLQGREGKRRIRRSPSASRERGEREGEMIASSIH